MLFMRFSHGGKIMNENSKGKATIKPFIYAINIETGVASLLLYNGDTIYAEAQYDLTEKYSKEEIKEMHSWLKG